MKSYIFYIILLLYTNLMDGQYVSFLFFVIEGHPIIDLYIYK